MIADLFFKQFLLQLAHIHWIVVLVLRKYADCDTKKSHGRNEWQPRVSNTELHHISASLPIK